MAGAAMPWAGKRQMISPLVDDDRPPGRVFDSGGILAYFGGMPAPFDPLPDPARRLAGVGMLRLALVMGGASALAGCAGSARKRPRAAAPARPRSNDLPGTELGVEVVVRAMGLIGVPYQWGGTDPREGFDCSGLVNHVYLEAAGLRLPRTSRLISERGRHVARTRLAPADLVFFNTSRRAFSHVGIYIGDDRFVHAPSSGSLVRVDSIEGPYWRQRYVGARRLLDV